MQERGTETHQTLKMHIPIREQVPDGNNAAPALTIGPGDSARSLGMMPRHKVTNPHLSAGPAAADDAHVEVDSGADELLREESYAAAGRR